VHPDNKQHGVTGAAGITQLGIPTGASAGVEEEDHKRKRSTHCDDSGDVSSDKRSKPVPPVLHLGCRYTGTITRVSIHGGCHVTLDGVDGVEGRVPLSQLVDDEVGWLLPGKRVRVEVVHLSPCAVELKLLELIVSPAPPWRYDELSLAEFCTIYCGGELETAADRVEKAMHHAVMPPAADLSLPLISRRDAMRDVLAHGNCVFKGHYRGYGVLPLGLVLGGPGAGKTKLFHHLVNTPELHYEDYIEAVRANGMPVSNSPLDPATCLYAAVSLTASTPLGDTEEALLRVADVTDMAIALRLVYQYLTSVDSYEEFVWIVRGFATARPGSWRITFSLGAVLHSIRVKCGKQRVFLLVDDAAELKRAFYPQSDADRKKCIRCCCCG
jgi:hypothetical protein